MKVVLEAQHACTEFPRGIGRYAISLIRQLVIRGQNQYALSFFDFEKQMGNRKYIEQYFGDLNIPIHECNILSYFDAFTKNDIKTYEEYTRSSADIFHFMHYIKFPEVINGVPVITIHDTMPLQKPEWFEPRIVEYSKIFSERIKRTKPLLLANSQCTKNDIIEHMGVSEEQIWVIPHAYDRITCYPDKNQEIIRNLKIDSPYLLYMGPLDERKNIRTLLNAFQIFTEKYGEVRLIIAGVSDVYTGNAVLREIMYNKKNNRIAVLGPVTDDERRILFSCAIAFVFPSLYEGFGVPVLEAFACGCPVITSNTSALSEIAGDAAIQIDPLNAEELAYQMEQVVGNSELRSQLVVKGFQKSEEFSWEKTAELTEKAYIYALDRKSWRRK